MSMENSSVCFQNTLESTLHIRKALQSVTFFFENALESRSNIRKDPDVWPFHCVLDPASRYRNSMWVCVVDDPGAVVKGRAYNTFKICSCAVTPILQRKFVFCLGEGSR